MNNPVLMFLDVEDQGAAAILWKLQPIVDKTRDVEHPEEALKFNEAVKMHL